MLFGKKGEDLLTGKMPQIDQKEVKETEVATFSLGCFWGPDALFGSIPGVIRTEVGYAGGSKKNPTYRSLGDHTETIQIEFDPEKIEYEDLLRQFWKSHDPTQPRKKQYRSMIFYHDEEQRIKAGDSKQEYPKEAVTLIKEHDKFYPAEDYHQKYKLSKKKAIFEDFKSLFDEFDDFVDSTAVARANGYVSGHGELNSAEELEKLGLNEEGRELLYNIWKKAGGR